MDFLLHECLHESRQGPKTSRMSVFSTVGYLIRQQLKSCFKLDKFLFLKNSIDCSLSCVSPMKCKTLMCCMIRLFSFLELSSGHVSWKIYFNLNLPGFLCRRCWETWKRFHRYKAETLQQHSARPCKCWDVFHY